MKKKFDLERWGKTSASFDLFNVTNSNVVRSWDTASATTTVNGAPFPTFRKPSSIINPRIFRLSFKWDF